MKITGEQANAINSSYDSCLWYKEMGEDYFIEASNLPVQTFTSGLWRYDCMFEVSNKTEAKVSAMNKEPFYTFTDDCTVKINGEEWIVYNRGTDDYSSFVCAYKDFEMPEPKQLVFHDFESYDIGENYINHEISSRDFSDFTEGGSAPYTYSIVSGPSWLHINGSVLEGTPTTVGQNIDLVIKCKDSASNEDTITIAVGETRRDFEKREVISTIEIVSDDINDIPSTKNAVSLQPSLKITKGQPAYLNLASSSTYWETQVDGRWTMATSGYFEEGKDYRLKTSIFVNNSKEDGSSSDTAGFDYMLASQDAIKITLNGEAVVIDDVYVGKEESVAYVYSKTYTTAKKVEPEIGTGSIQVPKFENVKIGYGSMEYKPVKVTFTSKGKVDGARLHVSLYDDCENAFEVVTHFDREFEAPGSYDDIVLIRPVQGLSTGNFVGSISVDYDNDLNGEYETTIGTQELSFGVEKIEISEVDFKFDIELRKGETYSLEDIKFASTNSEFCEWGGEGVESHCIQYLSDTGEWTALEPGEAFEENKEYQLHARVVANSGCTFAENCKVMLNGEEVSSAFNEGVSVEIYKNLGSIIEDKEIPENSENAD